MGCSTHSRARTSIEMPATEDCEKVGAFAVMAPNAPSTAEYSVVSRKMCRVQMIQRQLPKQILVKSENDGEGV